MTDSIFNTITSPFRKSQPGLYRKFDNSLQSLSRLGDCFKDSVCTFLIRREVS